MMHAVFFNDPEELRHNLMLSDWKIYAPVPAGTFTSSKAATARRISSPIPTRWARRVSNRQRVGHRQRQNPQILHLHLSHTGGRRVMKQIIVGVTTLLFTICITTSVSAYAHANQWGGSTSHSFGDTSHTSAFGTSTSHAFGVGTAHTNVYGGTTAHGYDGGTVHTTPYGPTAYRPPGSYYGYRPPTTVNYYGAHCYNCGSGGPLLVLP